MLHILLVSLISLADAAIYFDGPCPEVKSVDNFNLTAYSLNPWYEIAKYPSALENNADCSIISYKNEDGIVTFTFKEVVNKTVQTYDGFIDYDPNTRLVNHKSFAYQAQEKTNVLSVFIMAIDYDSYTIGFECSYDELKNQRHEYAWILSRSKDLHESSKVAVDKYLKSSTIIDRTKLIWNHYDEEYCKVED